MSENSLTLKEFKHSFQQSLSIIYDKMEVEHIFFLVVETVLGYSRVEISLNSNRHLDLLDLQRLESIEQQLLLNRPIQYILGFAHFYGLEFFVDENVLIPRPETEELVRWIIDESNGRDEKIIDLGTGSGCVPITLKKHCPQMNVYGIDISVNAINIAQKNADMNNTDVNFFIFDLLNQESLGFELYDIMISNPPYVTLEDKDFMKPNVLDYEPPLALFVPKQNPLIYYRKILDLTDGHLKSGGKLFFEINERFGPEIRSLLIDRGFKSVEIRKDLTGRTRMAKGVKV